MTTSTKGSVLILGGHGKFGRHATSAFGYHGWDVRQFDRRTDTLWDAAWGADVIVNAWNPQYPDWAAQVPKMTAQVIEIAQASGATVLIPGNVYGFGAGAGSTWSETSPMTATNPMGRIRIEMEAAYRAAKVRTIILRAGDFIDDRCSGNWFDKIITAKLNRGKLIYPGRTEALHSWAWLPDLAEVAVALAERRADLPCFTDVPFPGYTLTGAELAQAVEAVLERPIQLRRMDWLPLRLLSPFWKLAKSLNEMRWLWDHPHQLDGTRLTALLPEFTPTPLAEALSLALEHHIRPNQTVPGGALSFHAQ